MGETVGEHEMNYNFCEFPCSISMTTCSTLLALGMMPLCLFVYTKIWTETESIVIPYDSIGESNQRFLSLSHIFLLLEATIFVPAAYSIHSDRD